MPTTRTYQQTDTGHEILAQADGEIVYGGTCRLCGWVPSSGQPDPGSCKQGTVDFLASIQSLEGQVRMLQGLLNGANDEARTMRDAAQRELRGKEAAYRKLDVMSAEYRRLATALAQVIDQWVGQADDPQSAIALGVNQTADDFLAALRATTMKLED